MERVGFCLSVRREPLQPQKARWIMMGMGMIELLLLMVVGLFGLVALALVVYLIWKVSALSREVEELKRQNKGS